ncbi:sensor histidine kinase [Tepidimonas sp.]|uniref:sensor histidine kinase n=1 Tax=Tepidimonas sp. TaxID=2002775 RepID=UPI004054FB56
MAARVAVALSLLALSAFIWWNGHATAWVPALAAVWLALGTLTLAMPPAHASVAASAPPWLFTVWADVAVLAALQWTAPASLNITPLLVWPVLLAATAGPRRLALASAAAGTLALLTAAWRTTGGAAAETTAWAHAALTGSGLFLIALLANHLVARVIGERGNAQRHARLAQLYADIHRHIATGSSEGVIVTDDRLAVWWANPAAARILGTPDVSAQSTQLHAAVQRAPGWPVLADAVRNAMRALSREGAHTAQTHDATLPLPGGGRRRIRLRVLIVTTENAPGAAVVFLEDWALLEQRLHNERLAAMGRVSAAIAHEIRNPLATIVQSCALLQEDDTLPNAQRQLLQRIERNAQRIEHTMRDVLEAARAPVPGETAPVVALDATVDAIVADWLRQHPQGERLQRHAGAANARVAFDPEHLRRVLINLLDNANRYASAAPASIGVLTQCSDAHAQLIVCNDGPAIPAEVRAYLYEPFFSSRSRSVGLGLYLSRELCRRYDGDLMDEPRTCNGRPGCAFIVRMPLRRT